MPLPTRGTGRMRTDQPYHLMTDKQKERAERNTDKQSRHSRNKAVRAAKQRDDRSKRS